MGAVTRTVSERDRVGRFGAAKRRVASLPPWLLVAAAAYAVVALFGLAYLVVSTA